MAKFIIIPWGGRDTIRVDFLLMHAWGFAACRGVAQYFKKKKLIRQMNKSRISGDEIAGNMSYLILNI